MKYKQPWISHPLVETVFILAPPFLSLLAIICFPAFFTENAEISPAFWLLLVVFVDAGHVYSTLYRTYFDPAVFRKHRTLLTTIPLAGFVAAALVYTLSDLWFWRLLAYIAVFHFIRQQYGFMRIYSRQDPANKSISIIDTVTIYAATLGPLLHWHLSGQRNFNWFIPGDFIFMRSGLARIVADGLYYLVLLVFVGKEMYLLLTRRSVNWPKFLVMAGTILSWYFGIVYYNGDMAFTLLNVVSHGIPYIALVWLYGYKQYTRKGGGTAFLRWLFSAYGIAFFIGLLCLLAYLEEGSWDLLVWKEHTGLFKGFPVLSIELSPQLLSLLVPFLILPQLTHYILDGFIWKIRKENFLKEN
jgi:hypothetical protein